MSISPADRERAHQVLDQLLDFLSARPPSSGNLRVGFNHLGAMHVETREMIAQLDRPLTDKPEQRKI